MENQDVLLAQTTDEDPEGKKSQIRALLLERLEGWVDELLEGDPPPTDWNAEDLPEGTGEPDLFSLHLAMTTLTEEFRLQTRGYRKLNEGIADISQMLDNAPGQTDQLKQLLNETFGENLKAARQEARQEGQAELIECFIEIHDRLFQTIQRLYRRLSGCGFISRLTGLRAIMEAVIQGLELAMARFDTVLAECGVRRYGEPGEQFDPKTMRATIIDDSLGKPSRMVTRVIRSGYYRFDKVLRYAEVEVAK